MRNTIGNIYFFTILFFAVLVSITALLLAGCANIPLPTRSERVGAEGVLGRCADFFAAYDQAVLADGVIDAGTSRVEGYPYLRSNRFIASFRKEVYDPEAFSDWIERMQMLDQEARQYEIANLMDKNRSEEELQEILRKAADCGDLLKQDDFEESRARQRLRKTISVPDEYMDWRRVLGIYPVAGWFVSRGVKAWHAEERRSFSLEPPPDWQNIVRYSPLPAKALPTTERIAAIVERDALGIPKYTSDALDVLFAIHAPVWEVETMDNEDRLGKLIWAAEDVLQVDTNIPITYTLVNFTRFEAEILTQLNYIIWFPSRPKTGVFDLYGGPLDGVNFRVTLDSNGVPLLYETIHNCGCFYKAYPTGRLKVRAQIDYAEPPLVFKAPAIDPNSETMVVAIKSRNHYVRHLYARPRQMKPEKSYLYLNYNELRSLPLPESGRKSTFDQKGIVRKTQRLERFLLWPTGVLSPGAMRQWGRHAVTLVGKRHFDEPFYLEKIFEKTSVF